MKLLYLMVAVVSQAMAREQYVDSRDGDPHLMPGADETPSSLLRGMLRDAVPSRLTTRRPGQHMYPACEGTDLLIRSGLICPFLSASRDRLTSSPSNFSTILSFRMPVNPSGALPMALLPQPPSSDPKVIDPGEKPTYYWYLRLVYTLYHFAYFSADQPLPSPFVTGWGQERAYYLLEGPGRLHRTPMAVSLVKDDRMVIIIRGTESGNEWASDFDGRVHRGFFTIFLQLRQEIEAEVARLKPRLITVSGHSLGGSVAALLAYHLQSSSKAGPTTAEAVLFAAPMTGDATFVDELSRRVNGHLRNVIYLGKGWEAVDGGTRRIYTLGDVLGQFTCVPLPGCPSIGTGSPDVKYQYSPFHNSVPFSPHDLPNAKRWLALSQLSSITPHSITANHLCSYMCLLASYVQDPWDMCSFPQDQEQGRPMDGMCYLPAIKM